MKRMILIAVVLLLVLGPSGVTAQDDRFPACDLEPTRDILTEQIAEVATWQDLMRFNRDVASSLAFCQDLVFEGGQGQLVIGPVEIPAGLYRLVFTSVGYGAVDVDALEGSCGYRDILGINVVRGDAVTGAEALFVSDGCEALLGLGNLTDDWTLEFRPL